MTLESPEKLDAEILRKEAEKALSEHRDSVRKQAESMLGKAGTDIARMSGPAIEKLLFEFQVHQIELELQNEELKIAHQELSTSRDEFELIYDLSPVAYLTMDEQGTIKKANTAATHLLNHTKEALVTQKLGKFIHPSDQDNYYFYLRDLSGGKDNTVLYVKLATPRTQSFPLECPGYTLYGCSRSFCSHNNPFTYVELRTAVNDTDKNNIQLFLSIQDITEYKHSQETISCLNEKLEQKILEQTSALMDSNLDLSRKIEELRHSRRQLLEREAKLNAIFNASVEGIITIDKAGVIISANTAVETIFGYREEELIGCSLDKLLSPSPSKKQGADLKNYLQAKAFPAAGLSGEVEGTRKDGSVVPLDISLAEFSIDDMGYVTAIVRDVSLRKHQEQLEKEHLEELARVSRICLVGEMGSGIAHEVNQPLTAIANYSQACLRFIGIENPDLDQLGEVLFKIHQQALKAGQVIRRMKNFVAPRKLYRTDTRINKLIEDAVDLCLADLKQNNIKLELNLAKEVPAVIADDVQIEQVVLNLIRNSIDALKDLPQENQRQIRIQSRMKSFNQIEVRVGDNGSGIDDIQKERILTPFFTTKAAGMGMGLSISRSIIEAHEGTLSFNSTLEEGTTFYFTLPIKGTLHDQ